MFSAKMILATLVVIVNAQTTENSFRAYIENFRAETKFILEEEVPLIEENSPFIDFEEIDEKSIIIVKHDLNDFEDEVSIQWPYLKQKYCKNTI